MGNSWAVPPYQCLAAYPSDQPKTLPSHGKLKPMGSVTDNGIQEAGG